MIGIETTTGAASIARIGIKTASGNFDVARGSILTASGGKDFFVAGGGSGLTLEASPASATGSAGSAGDEIITTNQITVSVSGGTAPYEHAWTFQSGDSGWTILSPSFAATRFRVEVPPADTKSGVFRDTVTDARGRTAFLDINAQAFNFGDLML